MARLPSASLDVVLPAFNEAANLPGLFAQLRSVLRDVTPHWRLLLVDDGSSDDTARVALAYGVWIVVEHLLWGHPLPGWPTLVVGLMFFGGVQLLSIGIIGEYIGRIFDEVKQRPVYLVDTGNPP
jgi:glycosyltransferase involved in cell wall biosynthesis